MTVQNVILHFSTMKIMMLLGVTLHIGLFYNKQIITVLTIIVCAVH